MPTLNLAVICAVCTLIDAVRMLELRRQINDELIQWDGILQVIGTSDQPSNTETEYLYSKTRQRSEDLASHNIKVSAFVLWRPIMTQLLAQSTINKWGSHNTFVGQCATGLIGQSEIFYGFIVDEIYRKDKSSDFAITEWKYIEFYPRCCMMRKETSVTFFNFRDCTVEEQVLLIHDALNIGNSTYLQEIQNLKSKLRESRVDLVNNRNHKQSKTRLFPFKLPPL